MTEMEYKALGKTGLRVSAIGLGCSRVGRSVFEDNRKLADSLLETAFDAGVNFFDTAPSYAYGDSERLLGKAFSNRRDRVIFATKGGFRYSSSARYGPYLLPFISPFRRLLGRRRRQIKKNSKKRQNFSAVFLRKNLEQSLRRLRTDYVDLYQLHSPPVDSIESDEVLRFLDDILKEGKARSCAASVGTVEEALACLKYPVYEALQIGFSLVDQVAAETVFPEARARGVGVVVKTPLSRGLLTENGRVMTGLKPEPYDHRRQAQRRQALEFLVSEDHPSVEIASMRFILDYPEVTSVLTGTVNEDHLRTNLRAVEACPLPEQVMREARSFQRRNLGSGAR